MLSKKKTKEAYYSFRQLLKFSIEAYAHSIDNYNKTGLKPCTLQGLTIIDSINDFKNALNFKDEDFNDKIDEINAQINRLKEIENKTLRR